MKYNHLLNKLGCEDVYCQSLHEKHRHLLKQQHVPCILPKGGNPPKPCSTMYIAGKSLVEHTCEIAMSYFT